MGVYYRYVLYALDGLLFLLVKTSSVSAFTHLRCSLFTRE